MIRSDSAWVAGNLRRYAKMQKPKLKARPKRLTEDEQIRRFLGGEEFSRVEAGAVSPTEYHKYAREMLKKVGAI